MKFIRMKFFSTVCSILICMIVFSGCWSIFEKPKTDNTYEGKLMFCVTPILPEDANQEQGEIYGTYSKAMMDNMLMQLSSELFAEELLTEWMDMSLSMEAVQRILQSVSYSYKQEEVEESGVEVTKTYILVDIYVENDLDFSINLYTALRQNMPSYIEDTMPVPSGYVSTQCTEDLLNQEVQ